MRRVHSRQRLVSWDAFDATAATASSDAHSSCPSSDDGSDFETCDHDSSLKRKRAPPVSLLAQVSSPCTVKAFPWELVDDPRTLVLRQDSSEACADLCSLPDELKLVICQYLTPEHEAKSLMQVNRSLRRLVLNSETLWKEFCVREWPWLESSSLSLDCSRSASLLHPSKLLPLSRHDPTDMQGPPAVDTEDEDEDDESATSSTTTGTKLSIRKVTATIQIEYTGAVGQGNRCVRSTTPLPCRLGPRQTSATKSLLQRLLRPLTVQPFCSPFYYLDGATNTRVCMAPRLTAYFEVSILAPAATEDGDAAGPRLRHLRRSTYISDCVAVGLVTSGSDQNNNRMPGWDLQSVGYHSDDGGLFFGSGHMQRRYGPTFGVGDTIGCGVDYDHQTIFFTLNGRYLGAALSLPTTFFQQEDLYPVVGLDSNALVRCNFQGPFEYDLFKEKVQPQADIVHRALRGRGGGGVVKNLFGGCTSTTSV